MSDNVNERSAKIKEIIMTNLEYLCEHSTNLDKILRSFLSGGIIDLDLWDEITSETKNPKTSSRYEAFYLLIVKKLDNKNTANILLQALNRSGNEHIVEKLDLEVAVNGGQGQEEETKEVGATSGSVASNNAALAEAERRKKAIFKSMDYISENSSNLTTMLVILQGDLVLSPSECEKIEAKNSGYDSFRMLYNLVANNLGRKGAYEVLVKALRKGLNEHVLQKIEASMQ